MEALAQRVGNPVTTVALVAALFSWSVVGQDAACAAGGFPPFTSEAIARGINYPVQGVPQSNGLYGFGVACVDLDDDGDDDIVSVGRLNGQVGVFENNGAGVFVNRSTTSGIAALPQASSICAADLNGDRLPELLFTQVGQPHRLYRNRGALLFETHPLEVRLTPSGAAKAASLSDIDGDGDLDFFFANYTMPSGPLAAIHNQLFRNDGATLNDIAPNLGISRPARSFLGIFSDLDLDGDADLYISNDRGHLSPLYAANEVWRNDGGGQFVDVSAGSNADVACFSMGVAVGDLDGNGLPDLLATNIPSVDPPVFGVNPLMLNQGGCVFIRSEALWQVEDLATGWGALFVDVDDDGRLDLFVNHQSSENKLWINPAGPPAVLVPSAGGATGVSTMWNYSTAHADLDGDGDQDLVENGLGSNLLVYINHAGAASKSVGIRLEGSGLNRSAVGARAVGRIGERLLAREVIAGGHGYLGQNTLELHFGLGGAKGLDACEIRFPDGSTRSVGPLSSGRWRVVHPAELGDGNVDGVWSAADRSLLLSCDGPVGATPCARFDFDGDMLVTEADLPLFEARLLERRSDIDGNRRTDARDLAALLVAWGAGANPADIDESGTVDALDLAILLEFWS